MPKILIDAGLSVECFEVHFNRGGDPVEDHKWLSLCGKRGWVAVTHDKRIRLEDPSTLAIVESNTQILTLIGSWTHADLAINLVNSIYVVERMVKREESPCILKLHMAEPHRRAVANAGRVEVYRDCKWLRERTEEITKRG